MRKITRSSRLVAARNARGAIAFESGAINDAGLIRGNDNDAEADAKAYQPRDHPRRSRGRYQSIGYRWASNLKGIKAAEPEKFVSYYKATSPGSSVVVASVTSQ